MARDLDLDLGLGHTAYVHHSSTSPTYQISLKSKKLSVDGRTDGRTDVRTDGRTFETHFIRSTQSQRSRPN